ncbi:Transcriptional regulator containing GAF, AAA-type ATPase, and DNA-binding Fis domains [Chitinophaga jiangningensis]|uniref:Transcriptional regulator containing GAF, AAA-type ATPase, and DNA-binding Fis domains n=1 Tax=Chitinophaga jiangningensis TaxID=1419482 RepID=A0A1M7L4R9_9BACT|nr:sigma 54-interacting transcriptional regulator [Chitinophaga jiangningensis]SHM73109.1 Transcriptional regulator containing GAF, AAA-type ATPase, and DNA-binding Fis domains [Chitinophaga jiangningensis]
MEKKILIVEDEFVVANDLRSILIKAGYQVCGIADSVDEALEMIHKYQPHLVLLDIYLKGNKTGIDLAPLLTEKNIAFVYLSANNNDSVLEAARATQPYGFLVKPFREKDVLVTLDMAHYRHAHSMESKLRKEQSLQLAITNIMTDDISWDERLLQVAQTLQPAVPFDFLTIGLRHDTAAQLTYAASYFRIGFNDYQTIPIQSLYNILGTDAPQFYRMCVSKPANQNIFNGKNFQQLFSIQPLKQILAKKYQLQSNMAIHLDLGADNIFIFSFYSKLPDVYTHEHLQAVSQLEASLRLAVDRLLAHEEIQKLSERLKNEKNYLQEELKTNSNFEEIIGTSPLLLKVFDQVTRVAPVNTSVLLLGESGTGKELVARAIHGLSPRKDKLLVKVNCAALPPNLIESELFGHEKGAFTGAMDRRIGKFELAHGGTIFLDEIGEMPLEMQTKLLRVLQEKEIERIGGKQTIKVDVRIIAATNRNLENETNAGRFRLDLYYRLNVFPVMLPPLRERKGDIPLLANFFGQKFAKKTGKHFHGIKPAAMEELLQYHWPGNIREMENIVEQAFVLNDGKSPLEWGRELRNPFSIPATADTPVPEAAPRSLHDVKELQQATEREYILSVLKKTNGRIRGAGGAAEILHLKPTTLESRMEKLGIKKTFITHSDNQA